MANRDLQILRLHDGELPESEARSLESALTTEEAQKLAALSDLSTALNAGMSPPEHELASLDLWAELHSRLPSPEAHQSSAVIPISRRKTVRFTAVLSALAAAAGLLVMFRATPKISNRCDIEELEVAGENAAVLSIPDENGHDTALIWFDHQETDAWESL